MSWAITFVAGLMGMLGGGIGMFAIAFACVKWYRISSFEGGSGYFVIALAILGGLVGLVLASVTARLAHSLVGPGWYTQLGLALLVVGASLAIVLAVAYLGADHTPDIGGQGIVVEWEVRLPAEGLDDFAPRGEPSDWPADELRLELVSVSKHVPRGSREAEFDRAAFRKVNGQWILPARVPLFTSKGGLCVNLTLGGRDDGFWPAMRPSPQAVYFEWSEWSRTNEGSGKPNDAAAVMYRFRYKTASE